MIEISHTTPRRDEKNKVKSKKKSASVGKGQKSFTTELQKTVAHEFKGSLDELLHELQDQEKKFIQYQTEYEFNKYKSLIQKILKMILDESTSEKTLKRTRKNFQDLIIVEKINEQLSALTEAITKRNKAFNLMKTIEDIRGLILDLVH